MKKSVPHFLSTIRLSTCVFALPYLLYLTLRVICLKAMRAAYLRGGPAQIIRCLFSPFAFYLCLSAFICGCFSSVSYASSPPANNVHFCEVLDYEDMRVRDSLYAAAKQALDLDVGEPRTVRMIYFLPNDRPFQQAVVDSMKVTIRQIQIFFADQIAAHGYGRKTFRFETDAQGDPVVHRVYGRHPDSHYLDDTVDTVLDEIERAFDIRQNIYLIVIDNSINSIGTGSGQTVAGVGGRGEKNGGFGLVPVGSSFRTDAHELGHAFGLLHDFRDGAYIMSYGRDQRRSISACHAEFLAVHPYFNASIPEGGRSATIDLISPTEYPPGSKSVPVQLKVWDEDELHQVILFVRTREPHSAAGFLEVKACRGLPGKYDYDAVVEFDYDGVIPSDEHTSFWNPDRHPIVIRVVDAKGNVRDKEFELICKNCPLTLVKISGDNQQGAPSTELANPLVIEARDKNGAVIEGTPVIFTVTAGNGWLSGKFTIENIMTDANGRAQSTLTLGPNAGTNTVEVSVAGFDPVTFNAVGIGTPTIPITGGDYQKWHLPDGAIVRLGKGYIGGSDRAVAFSPDGQCLALASSIGVWLYEVATSRPLVLLPTASPVPSVMFSPDGTLLASGLGNGRVELWEVETSTKVATFEGHRSRVTSVCFSPDGTLLASRTWDQIIKLWDVAEKREIGTWEVKRTDTAVYAASVVFSPDGTTLVSGFDDGTVRLWDVATRRNIVMLREHTHAVNSVSFSPDGTMLASGSGNGIVMLWDVATRRNIITLEGNTVSVRSVSFSPDGTMLASGSGNGIVMLWDVATRRNIITLEGNIVSVRSVSFSPDGSILASASGDGTVGLWYVETGNAVILSRHMTLRSTAFSSDGTTLASGSGNGVMLWDVASRKTIATLEGHTSWVSAVSFSPDGTTLASGSRDETVKLWDVALRKTIATLEGHTSWVSAVSFSPDGTTLASGSGNGVMLWDVASRKTIATLDSWVSAVSFSPDGTMLASRSRHEVKLWDVASRKTLARLWWGENSWGSEDALSFSPDGTMLASISGREVKLWDVALRKTIATLEGHTSWVNSVSFSPDGTMLASGSGNGIVMLWDVATRRIIVKLEGHTSHCTSVSFSLDGSILASASEDGTILLWDMSPYITPQTPTSSPTPDFDGDGTVGISDFLQFVEQFGFSENDEGYEARFDLDGDGVIGISDFLIFVDNFGKKVS